MKYVAYSDMTLYRFGSSLNMYKKHTLNKPIFIPELEIC